MCELVCDYIHSHNPIYSNDSLELMCKILAKLEREAREREGNLKPKEKNKMDKRLAIVCGDSVRDIVVSPGTEVREVLGQLNLPSDYWLSTRNGQPLHPSEIVYGMVTDGDKLFCSAPATVGV